MGHIFVYSDQVMLSGELIALVQKWGQKAGAVSIGEGASRELADYGADQVYILTGDSLRPEDYAAAVADLLRAQDAAAFLVGATVRGKDLAGQVAARLECGLVSDAAQIDWADGRLQTTRMMYGGLAMLTESLSGLNIVTIPPGKAEAAKAGDNPANMEKIRVQTDSRVKLLSREGIVREGVDITKAKRLLCVGMGFEKKEDLGIIAELAESLEAEIGCTRPIAEDKEWLPVETYIGLSGKVARPELYLALGVSGQIQHTYGIRDSKIVVGINNNEKATIFQAADYGIVGDLYEIVPLLTEAVQKARG